MKICTVVFLLGVMINCSTSMIHTLRYFKTSSSEIPNFPEYVEVGYLNDLVITHYDSKTKREVPKQEWMNRVTEDDPNYWDDQTFINLSNEQVGKVNIKIAKQRLNLTEGPHIFQRMHGCEWNDETDEIRGYYQVAFDGEDFIALDWETETWVAPKQQAFETKRMWEKYGVAVEYEHYFEHTCAESLKKYVRYGEKTLMRKELPRVSLLQKSSSSPVTCHATGFYPNRAMLFWAKDGEELEEDPGEILPNNDGTFQSSVSLDLSSVPTEDWGRYSCVFQLSGVPEDLITKLDPNMIRTNKKKHTTYIEAEFFLFTVLFAVAVFLVSFYLCKDFFTVIQHDFPHFRKGKSEEIKTPSKEQNGSREPEVMEKLNPPFSTKEVEDSSSAALSCLDKGRLQEDEEKICTAFISSQNVLHTGDVSPSSDLDE